MVDSFSIECDGHRLDLKSERIMISKGRVASDKPDRMIEGYPASLHLEYREFYKVIVTRSELATGEPKQYPDLTFRESKELPRRRYWSWVIYDEEGCDPWTDSFGAMNSCPANVTVIKFTVR